MQGLKESVRISIVNAAIAEFLTRGYEGTSMRGIASRSGITHGNIYRYFASKEVLFRSLVAKSESRLLEVLEEVLVPFDSHANVSAQLRELAQKLAQLVIEHRDGLMLLLEKGPSDNVALLRNKMVQMISSFFRLHIGVGGPFEDEFFLDLTSSNIHRGFLEIIRSNGDRDWTVKNLNLLVRYHLFGIANFVV